MKQRGQRTLARSHPARCRKRPGVTGRYWDDRPLTRRSRLPWRFGSRPACRQACRSEGCHAFTVRDLPDPPAGGQVAEVAVSRWVFRAILERTCLPQAGSAAPTAGTGAGMMVEPDETAGGCGGDGTGLPEPRSTARSKGVSDGISPRTRVDTPSIEPVECSLISGIVIESSRRPTAVVGMRPSGKSRYKCVTGEFGG